MILWKERGGHTGKAKKARSEENRFCGRCISRKRAASGQRISPASAGSAKPFCVWRKKYSGLALNELRELRQLREENGKLKRLVADLSLDRHMLQEIVRKKL